MEEQRDKSQFNMAVSYLYRLNGLFLTADSAAIMLDLYTWYHTLLALYRELSTEMTEKEITEAEATIDKIHPLVMETINDQKLSGGREISNNLYKEMHRFEMMLRKVTKKSGLLLKTMDDPAFAIGR